MAIDRIEPQFLVITPCTATMPAQWNDYRQKREFERAHPGCRGRMARVPNAPNYCPEPQATTSAAEYAAANPTCTTIIASMRAEEAEQARITACVVQAHVDSVSYEDSTPEQIQTWMAANPGCYPPGRIGKRERQSTCADLADELDVYTDSSEADIRAFLTGPGEYCLRAHIPERPVVPKWVKPVAAVGGAVALTAFAWWVVRRV